jgi:hypothetical protein
MGVAQDIKSLSKSPELGFGELLKVIGSGKRAALLLMPSLSLMANSATLLARPRRKEKRVGIKSHMLAVLITLAMLPLGQRALTFR